jgi:hypothetical protein
MPTLASQHATATPAVATQPTVSQPAVWIDNDAFPHIIRGIMSYAAMPELKAFRRVSRQCCAVVDAMLGYHLLLDGDFYEDFPRRSAVAALHNDVWAMVGDHRVYQ